MSAKPLPKIDESVKVPAAIARAAARATEIHNAAYKKPEEAPSETSEVKEVTPGVTPAPTDAPNSEAPAPAPAPAPTPATPAEPAKAADSAPVDWEQRYRAMKGRFGQSERVVRELQDRLAGMESVLANMQHHDSTQTSHQPELTPELHITKKDIDEYGADFVDLARRAAREEAAPRIAHLEKELREAQGTIRKLTGTVDNTAKTVQVSARQQMFKDLNDSLPNWKQLNNDPKFLDWLDLPDTYSGVMRSELLKAADAASDASRVLAFFKGFLAEEAAKVPQDPAPTPTADPAIGKVPLETFAAPGRAKSAPVPPAAEKPIFTRAQVTQFYLDTTRGVYAGRENEKKQMEHQIHLAGREGRIR